MMSSKRSIGIIGAGNMGCGIATGLISNGSLEPTDLTVVDVREEALLPLRAIGVRTSTVLTDAVQGRDTVILGIKPQVAGQVLDTLGPVLQSDQVLVSIMAGVSTTSIEAQLPIPVPVIRAMPQSLVRLAAAATGLCAGRHAATEHLDRARLLFDALGSTVVVEEKQMDAVTGLSGSGPAYVYTFIEALSDGGVRAGLSREVALTLAVQTVLGAARMMQEEGAHPAVLRDQVTSPGGTTIAGLHMLEEKGLRDAVMSAVVAATQRSAELGQA
jgi:pyrroline-5-carboxylate reductase